MAAQGPIRPRAKGMSGPTRGSAASLLRQWPRSDWSARQRRKCREALVVSFNALHRSPPRSPSLRRRRVCAGALGRVPPPRAPCDVAVPFSRLLPSPVRRGGLCTLVSALPQAYSTWDDGPIQIEIVIADSGVVREGGVRWGWHSARAFSCFYGRLHRV